MEKYKLSHSSQVNPPDITLTSQVQINVGKHQAYNYICAISNIHLLLLHLVIWFPIATQHFQTPSLLSASQISLRTQEHLVIKYKFLIFTITSKMTYHKNHPTQCTISVRVCNATPFLMVYCNLNICFILVYCNSRMLDYHY